MQCPNCGKPLAADEAFCANCGTPRPQVQAAPQPAAGAYGGQNPYMGQAPQQPAPRKSHTGVIIAVVAVVCVAAALFLGKDLIAGMGKGQEETTQPTATTAVEADAPQTAAPEVSAETPQPATEPSVEQGSDLPLPEAYVAADQLIGEFNRGKSSFNSSYAGRTVYVKGVVAEVQNTADYSIVYVKSLGNVSGEMACHFAAGEGDLSGKYQVGDFIQLVGKMETATMSPKMSGCVVYSDEAYRSLGVQAPDVYIDVDLNMPENYGEYIFPSDTRLLTRDDLVGRSREEIIYMRNELYARYGYTFTTDNNKAYFASKSWYHANPNVNGSTFGREDFNEIEKANLDTILAYEREMGWK